VKTDFATLESEYQRLFDLVKRLSQRQALADHKAGKSRQLADDRPLTKEEAKRKYLGGKTHVEIARDAMKGVQ
jgi:hypothetical protein